MCDAGLLSKRWKRYLDCVQRFEINACLRHLMFLDMKLQFYRFGFESRFQIRRCDDACFRSENAYTSLKNYLPITANDGRSTDRSNNRKQHITTQRPEPFLKDFKF